MSQFTFSRGIEKSSTEVFTQALSNFRERRSDKTKREENRNERWDEMLCSNLYQFWYFFIKKTFFVLHLQKETLRGGSVSKACLISSSAGGWRLLWSRKKVELPLVLWVFNVQTQTFSIKDREIDCFRVVSWKCEHWALNEKLWKPQGKVKAKQPGTVERRFSDPFYRKLLDFTKQPELLGINFWWIKSKGLSENQIWSLQCFQESTSDVPKPIRKN